MTAKLTQLMALHAYFVSLIRYIFLHLPTTSQHCWCLLQVKTWKAEEQQQLQPAEMESFIRWRWTPLNLGRAAGATQGQGGDSETSLLGVERSTSASISGKVQLHGQSWERVPQVPSPTASTQLPMFPQPPRHISRVSVCHFCSLTFNVL